MKNNKKELEQQLLDIKSRLHQQYNEDLHPSINNLKNFLALQNNESGVIDRLLAEQGFKPRQHRTPHVSASYNAIAQHLPNTELELTTQDMSQLEAQAIKAGRTKLLLGDQGGEHPQHILLTLPSIAADKPEFIEDAIKAGVSAVRINTAHDHLDAWKSMAIHTKIAAKKHKKKVKVYVDLASWKMRTAKSRRTLQPILLSDKKQRTRVLLSSAQEAFTCVATSSKAIDHLGTIAVTQHFIDLCSVGENIVLKDARGKTRKLEIIDKTTDSCLCVLTGKTIIDKFSTFTLNTPQQSITVLPQRVRPQPEIITVRTGDTLIISGDAMESTASYTEGKESKPVILAITDPEMLQDTLKGQTVVLDDGKVHMEIIEKKGQNITCKIIATTKDTVQIKEEKGVNFPDTELSFPALSEEDKQHLPHILEFADIIGISFAQEASDILEVKRILALHNKSHLGIVAKIETKKGIKQLPEVLEELIDHENGGIMIARGDLAVEVGFHKLAHHQQQIIEMCKAAHIPVIYATGICETGMKKGQATRSEIVDLDQSLHADCTMLNKGPYVLDIIQMIHDMAKAKAIA